jgi:hypothetical protein
MCSNAMKYLFRRLPSWSWVLVVGVAPSLRAEPNLAKLSVDAKKAKTKTAIHALFEALPHDGKRAVFEGDLLYTEDDLFDYLAGSGEPNPDAAMSDWLGKMNARRPTAALISLGDFIELKARTQAGVIVYWHSRADRQFKFALDGASFHNDKDYYFAVQTAFVAATKDWETICPECDIHFTYDWQSDWKHPRPGTDLTFVVQARDVGGDYVAASFYPDWPKADRYVYVDPSYVKSRFDHTGVFRHEIGHILGYRHEHLEGVSGCQREGGEWKNLSPYDPHSVMHYACDASASILFEFSPEDIDSHRRLYTGLIAAGGSPSDATDKIETWLKSPDRATELKSERFKRASMSR